MPIEPRGGITRRDLLLGAGAVGVCLALLPRLVRPAAADAVSTAQALVAALSQELTQLVNSAQDQAGIEAGFERIVARYADMGPIAASILGQPWRTATAAQKQAFVAGFQRYFARKYGRTFGEYRNATISVTGARDAGKSGVLIQSTVVRPGQETVAVDWQISDRSGAAKVVNLIIEGVSMLANERAEVGAMLDAQGGSIDGLVAAMRSA